MLGQCHSLNKKGNGIQFSETEIGETGTSFWYVGSLDNNKTLTLLFETLAKDKSPFKQFHIQFQTIYKYKGELRGRVTTIKRNFAETLPQLA